MLRMVLSITLSTVVTGLTNQRPSSRTAEIETGPLVDVPPTNIKPNGTVPDRSPARQMSAGLSPLPLTLGYDGHVPPTCHRWSPFPVDPEASNFTTAVSPDSVDV